MPVTSDTHNNVRCEICHNALFSSQCEKVSKNCSSSKSNILVTPCSHPFHKICLAGSEERYAKLKAWGTYCPICFKEFKLEDCIEFKSTGHDLKEQLEIDKLKAELLLEREQNATLKLQLTLERRKIEKHQLEISETISNTEKLTQQIKKTQGIATKLSNKMKKLKKNLTPEVIIIDD